MKRHVVEPGIIKAHGATWTHPYLEGFIGKQVRVATKKPELLLRLRQLSHLGRRLGKHNHVYSEIKRTIKELSTPTLKIYEQVLVYPSSGATKKQTVSILLCEAEQLIS